MSSGQGDAKLFARVRKNDCPSLKLLPILLLAGRAILLLHHTAHPTIILIHLLLLC